MSGLDQPKELVFEMLKIYLGEEQGHKTFTRWYNYITEQFNQRTSYIDDCFKAIEPVNQDEQFVYDQLIIIDTIRCSMLCPHHLLPVEMDVNIGYIPDKDILGLSKFARVAQEYAKPPKTQEKYTAGLANLIKDKLKANWVIVVVDGKHSCMRHRGVESRDSRTKTHAIAGDKELSMKQEFMMAVYNKK